MLDEQRHLDALRRHLECLEARHLAQMRGGDRRDRPHVVLHQLSTQHHLDRCLALRIQRAGGLHALVRTHLLHERVELPPRRRRVHGAQLRCERVQELLDTPQHVELPNLFCLHDCPLRGVKHVGRLSLWIRRRLRCARDEDSGPAAAGVVSRRRAPVLRKTPKSKK